MLNKIKKISIVCIMIFMSLAFSNPSVLADDNDVNDLGSRITTDTNKVWSIRFNSELDMASILNSIQIQDAANGTLTSANVVPGNDDYTVQVKPPAAGYQVDHTYKLILNSSIKSTKGKNLNKNAVLNFTPILPSSNKYNALGKVEVSTVMDTFKKITLDSSNLPGVEKYKLEGNNNLVDLGTPIYSVITTSTAKVYLCDKNGNILANASVNVSTTDNNVNLKLSFQ